MSDVVHGFASNTGFQMREESSPGVGIGTWMDVPIISEGLKTTHQFAQPSPEFSDTGAETIVTHIGSGVVGPIQFNARIDARWFQTFLGHLAGTEDLRNEEHLDGSASGVADDVSSHWYLPSNQRRTLQFRAWKSGDDATGRWSEFRGCLIGDARIEWVPDGLLTWTLGMFGLTETLTDVSGSLGAPSGAIVTDPRWASNSGSIFESGATPGAISFRGFVFNINRSVTQTPSFANTIDTANLPGPTSKRIVTVNITSFVQQNYAAADQPYREFVDRTASKVRIKLRDTTVTDDSGVYGLDFDFPSAVWTEGDTALKEGGPVPAGYTFQAKSGTPAAPVHSDLDYRIGAEVKESDEPPTTPDHFSEDTGTVTQLTDGV